MRRAPIVQERREKHETIHLDYKSQMNAADLQAGTGTSAHISHLRCGFNIFKHRMPSVSPGISPLEAERNESQGVPSCAALSRRVGIHKSLLHIFEGGTALGAGFASVCCTRFEGATA
jgi:hypothetical protein